jgi:hypothetical protein
VTALITMKRAIADYDVALSFAGEDRAYVSEVARITSTPQTWGTEWIIDGRKLLLFLPRLRFLPWIADTFNVAPNWQGPRPGSNDPAKSGGISFDLVQP